MLDRAFGYYKHRNALTLIAAFFFALLETAKSFQQYAAGVDGVTFPWPGVLFVVVLGVVAAIPIAMIAREMNQPIKVDRSLRSSGIRRG